MMQTVALDTRQALSAHEAAIERLFLECFGDRMSLDIWRWAYFHNPNGEPWVTVCYDGDAMVGHYAMIPMPIGAHGTRLRTCLSMTTMVAATHRQHGLFVKLATSTYERARDAGVEWVMGFPNEMSAPGFERRLAWVLGEPDCIVSAPAENWWREFETLRNNTELLRLDLRDESTRQWRLSRPGARYEWQDGIAYKRFGETIDVLSYDAPEQLRLFPGFVKVNLLLPSGHPCAQRFEATPYRFGGVSLAGSFNANRILRNMALSDVF
jgi:hypothetical protein